MVLYVYVRYINTYILPYIIMTFKKVNQIPCLLCNIKYQIESIWTITQL